MRRPADRRVTRQTWLMVAGVVACTVGLVIAAQDHTAGLYLALLGGLLALGAFISRG